ncbi:Lrp/AsnC ligand binding domain-containing protein [Candidatus Bathycorpusculum sp.]|uniref:Lrp/AsnC family transcriptional regulator n=1 Tax=Candidatus Bathycorpusculum sp. TaxID=2994959 RepID=UPI0028296A5C|nr:Lrp/AsnC ligand binding domain-containing protein [Candidatus Termitimicrobium sp.]MCL2431719.1 Lrp/AsnC ligand binding domain-containing protein [Candidatus Termitimicrobium sp.]
MENIFVEQQPQISVSIEDPILKPKRSAFIFITAESESSHRALDDLRKIEDVQEVYLALGAYDLIAKVRGESLDHIRDNVLKRIRNLSSIKSTLTLTVI